MWFELVCRQRFFKRRHAGFSERVFRMNDRQALHAQGLTVVCDALDFVGIGCPQEIGVGHLCGADTGGARERKQHRHITGFLCHTHRGGGAQRGHQGQQAGRLPQLLHIGGGLVDVVGVVQGLQFDFPAVDTA